jgi:hypothetical protein
MGDLDKDIDEYFAAKARIHEAFGYKPDWVEIPMRDQRSDHWMLVDGEGPGGRCVYSELPLTLETVEKGEAIYGGPIYSGPIYTQRFLPKWVYRAGKHVMVSVDTETDGNKFLMIFDADKECTDEVLREAYSERWG